MISVLFPDQKTEKTEFLSFFYKYCMHVLTAPLLANTAHDKNSKGELRRQRSHKFTTFKLSDYQIEGKCG